MKPTNSIVFLLDKNVNEVNDSVGNTDTSRLKSALWGGCLQLWALPTITCTYSARSIPPYLSRESSGRSLTNSASGTKPPGLLKSFRWQYGHVRIPDAIVGGLLGIMDIVPKSRGVVCLGFWLGKYKTQKSIFFAGFARWVVRHLHLVMRQFA